MSRPVSGAPEAVHPTRLGEGGPPKQSNSLLSLFFRAIGWLLAFFSRQPQATNRKSSPLPVFVPEKKTDPDCVRLECGHLPTKIGLDNSQPAMWGNEADQLAYLQNKPWAPKPLAKEKNLPRGKTYAPVGLVPIDPSSKIPKMWTPEDPNFQHRYPSPHQ